MELSNEQLIAEAIETNHAGVGKDRTLDRYRDLLVHYSQYLASVFGVTFYTAKRKHVRMFMNHLAKPGGPQPHDSRLQCAWCKTRGYPDGRSGPGWSPSYRKSYLAAIKFLSHHFLAEEDLPDLNPAALEQAPKVPIKSGYTPSSDDVKKLLDCPGTPKGRLLAHWLFYAPSRRQTFSDARWRDIDLDQGTWRVMGKGDKFDIFDLAPPLIRVLRLYRSWQLTEAARHEAIRERPGRPRDCLRPADQERAQDHAADDQQDREMARGQGGRRRPQIAGHPRCGRRPHLARLSPFLPPRLGDDRAQREGTAHRRCVGGLEAQRHRDDASPLRADEVGPSAGSTHWHAFGLRTGRSLSLLGVEAPEHEQRDIDRYFESQSRDDPIVRSEKITTEAVIGQRYDVWEVEAESGRWWVITNLTNLYSQEKYPSMDECLSFHIGLMERILAKQMKEDGIPPEEEDRMPAAWRKLAQAEDALERADEAEEFQAVAMRLREALIRFAKEAAESDKLLPSDQDQPKKGDFVGWSRVVAETVAKGRSNKPLRSYMTAAAKTNWELVAALTHDDDSTKLDGEIAVAATANTLLTYTAALVRFERGAPDRCPECESYRVVADYRPEIGSRGAYISLCANCGWEDDQEKVA